MEFNTRNKGLDSFSFGPSEISPDRAIHSVAPSKVRSDLENDTDNQCKSASCIIRPRSATPPEGKVYCYICGYPCFQNGGTIYDTFSVQCEHVLPVAALSLLSGLADGTSTKSNKFSEIVTKVKKNIGVNKQITDEYDMWAGRIIGSPEYSRIIGAYKSVPPVGIEPEPEDSMEHSPKPSVGIEPEPEDSMAIDETSLSRSNLSMKGAMGEVSITGEQFNVQGGGSAVDHERIKEGGGIRGSSYQWAHPVCNMVKSNYPFIIICHSKYGFFFVSDNLEILLPPGIKEPLGEERNAIIQKVPGSSGFKSCNSLSEYYNEAISTHNLTWLLRTVLGMTGEYGSYSEQWLKGILLENAEKSEKPGKPPKGINWANGGYKQILDSPENTSNFSMDDPIFSEAMGKRDSDGLKLKLLIDGNIIPSLSDGEYISIDEWIEKRIQHIKNNILIPILQNICSDPLTPPTIPPTIPPLSPYPVYQISNLNIDEIPKVSLFAMISTTATGSKICHNMARMKKTFFDISKDKRKNKVNIIWSSILFEELLDVCSRVIEAKPGLGLTFDMNVSKSIRNLAKTGIGLTKILKNSIKSTGKIINKIKTTKKIKKRKKGGGSAEEGLVLDLEGNAPMRINTQKSMEEDTLGITPKFNIVDYSTNLKDTTQKSMEEDSLESTPKFKSEYSFNVIDKSADLTKNISLLVKIIEHVFTDKGLIDHIEAKLLYYLESNEYPLFNEFLFDFIGLDEDILDDTTKLEFNDSVILDSLKEYGEQDPCLFSSLPESLCNEEGLNYSYFLEVAQLNGYDEVIKSPDDPEYSDWWIYTEFIEKEDYKYHKSSLEEMAISEETAMGVIEKAKELERLEKLQKKARTRKKKKNKRKSKKKKTKRKSNRKKKRKTTKKKKKGDLIDKIIDRLGY